jgi:hypothetical protein
VCKAPPFLGLCTKTTHVSEGMINSNVPQRLPRTYESHQRELVDRSFRLEEAENERIHQLTLMVFLTRGNRRVGRNSRYPLTNVSGFCAKPVSNDPLQRIQLLPEQHRGSVCAALPCLGHSETDRERVGHRVCRLHALALSVLCHRLEA